MKKLKYKEQLALSREAVVILDKGGSLTDLRTQLSKRGLYKLDLDRVIFSALNQIKDKYDEQIKLSIAGISATKPSHLHEEVLTKIVRDCHIEMADGWKNKITKYINEGYNDDEIYLEIQNMAEDKNYLKRLIQRTRTEKEISQTDKKEEIQGVLTLVATIIFGLCVIIFAIAYPGLGKIMRLFLFFVSGAIAAGSSTKLSQAK